jgi:NAD(P)-dependent dehydrogenase (short-subunit alcohol dehydrogenase family)
LSKAKIRWFSSESRYNLRFVKPSRNDPKTESGVHFGGSSPMTKTVLITGASKGIGRATAIRLTAMGHIVFGTSRTPPSVPQEKFELLPLEVHSEESVAACVETVMAKAGRIDVLINNAGVSVLGALEESSLDEVKAVFETNVYGVLRVTNAVLPIMRRQRAGQIINMSSIGGLIGVPFLGVYCASKFALEGYTESLRHEVKALGIQVSLVEPGDIHTDIYEPDTAMTFNDYANARRRFTAIHSKSMAQAPPPEIVANVISKIVESKSPRLRYVVGKESSAIFLKRVLPSGIAERALRRYFQLDR